MEIWKDIPWYEWLYQVSNLWNIKWLKYNILKKLNANKYWYIDIVLSNKWLLTYKLVHRLVAQAFIPNPENKPQVTILIE